MKNLVTVLKERSDVETVKITIQVFSGALLFIAIIAGNWNLIT